MRPVVAAGVVVTLLITSPAFAGPRSHKRTQSIVKWALIGAGAGFGLGFVTGMSANEHKPFAEQKTWQAAWAGALVGGALGGGFGASRATDARTPGTAPRELPFSKVSRLSLSEVKAPLSLSPSPLRLEGRR